MHELFWLLLPLAAASGWYLARRTHPCPSPSPGVPAEYFKGLNYLINEQPDKAIEVFLKMAEVDSQTIEIHLALGNLFRRRGEVDRAIRIHQNLVARPSLSFEQRSLALLELGQDYLRAGLFDRAESLFLELIELNAHTARALRFLGDIYQQEKEWDKAISIARKLEQAGGESLGVVIAHFYCEQAEQARQDQSDKAEEMLRQALDSDPRCARAMLLCGAMAEGNGDFKRAISLYKKIERQDVTFVPEIVLPLVRCHSKLGTPGELREYLEYLQNTYGGVAPLLALADVVRDHEGPEVASRYLLERLHRHPSLRGVARLVEMKDAVQAETAGSMLGIVKEAIGHHLENRPAYRCTRCGFTGKSLHWCCPGCRSWNTVKPASDLEGELCS